MITSPNTGREGVSALDLQVALCVDNRERDRKHASDCQRNSEQIYPRLSLPSRGPRTQRDYARHIAILHREFGSRIAEELKPRDFGPFLNDLPPSGRGRIQRCRTLAVLSAAFTDAVSRWYMLERNVLRDVKRHKNPPRDRLITDKEFAELLWLAPKRYQYAMRLALLTGQRQGDIIRFKWTDIQEGALHVVQAKTRKRIAIGLNPDLKRLLGHCWALKGGGKDGGEYIVPTRTGKPYTSEGFRAGWQRIHRKWLAMGREPLHFHDIRALAATKCSTPEIAQRLLGHQTVAMTLRVYRRGVEHVDALSLSTG